jgi:hypothetical protein
VVQPARRLRAVAVLLELAGPLGQRLLEYRGVALELQGVMSTLMMDPSW